MEKRTITIPADVWKRWRALKSEIAALERSAKALEKDFPLPPIGEETVGDWVIVDGNGDQQGKMSVFPYPGATIPAGWRKRIS